MRKFKSAADKKAFLDHEKWKRARGIKKPAKSRSGFMPKPDAGRCPNLPPTSDSCAYVPTVDKFKDKSYIKAVEERASSVAPSFNKGPLQPQTSNDLFESRRR